MECGYEHEKAGPCGQVIRVPCASAVEVIKTFGGDPFARVCGSGHVAPIATQTKPPPRCRRCGCRYGHATGCQKAVDEREPEAAQKAAELPSATDWSYLGAEYDGDPEALTNDQQEEMEAWAAWMTECAEDEKETNNYALAAPTNGAMTRDRRYAQAMGRRADEAAEQIQRWAQAPQKGTHR